MTCFRLSNGKTLNEFCNEHNVSYTAVWRRLDEGKSIEEAVEEVLK